MENDNIMTSPVSQDTTLHNIYFQYPHLLPIQDYITFCKNHPQPPKPIKHRFAKPISKAIIGIDIVEVPSHTSQYWPKPKESVKKFVRERDNYTCQICGEWGNVVDHINPLRVSHDSSTENLRVLCQYHNMVTRMQRRDARPDFDTWINLLKESIKSEPLSLPTNCLATKDSSISPCL